jgi:YVTN family beta-propeller protein
MRKQTLSGVIFLSTLFFSNALLADEAFITAQNGQSLDIIDLSSMKKRLSVPIEGKPAGVAVSKNGRRVFVTSPEGRFITVVDTKTGHIEQRILVKGGPLAVVVSNTGRRLYVTDFYDDMLVEIDLKTHKQRRLAIGPKPAGLALTPDGKMLLVAARDDNQIVFVDAHRFRQVDRLQVGRHPFGVTIDDDGRSAYAANVESDTVSVIDLVSRKARATLHVESHPYGVALASERIFVSNQHSESLSVFNAKDLTPVATVKVGDYPEGICASLDGATVYVANWFSNELWAIDALSLKVRAKTATSDGPRAFGLFVGPAL